MIYEEHVDDFIGRDSDVARLRGCSRARRS
jgi:hypothetical protein